MKAKEYAEQFLKDPSEYLLIKTSKAFVLEIAEIRESRGVTTDDGLHSIIKELDDKWIAFAKLVNKKLGKTAILEKGFMKCLKAWMPEFYDEYNMMYGSGVGKPLGILNKKAKPF